MKAKNFIILLSILGINQLSACSESFDQEVFDSPEMLSTDEIVEVNSEAFVQYIDQLPLEELSHKEIESLKFMREEEKLARDVYLTLYEQWAILPFKNISKSEQAHMDAVLLLLNKYNLDDPADGNDIGVFANEELHSLYDQLVEQGSTSIAEALKVGALIEEVDIIDLQRIIDHDVDNEDIEFVLSNLKRASGYHLRAFVRNLKRYSIEYVPELLDEETYNDLIK